ncbi:hypothetical protein AO269_19725 [Pseudomonas putida]|nr:hypothetical protein AO269_19725 [Pseudomonas putida]
MEAHMEKLGWLNRTTTLRDTDAWNKIWAVYDDPIPHIRCKTCGNHQLLQNSDKEFPHMEACTAQGAHSKLPWGDLLWIVGRSLPPQA